MSTRPSVPLIVMSIGVEEDEVSDGLRGEGGVGDRERDGRLWWNGSAELKTAHRKGREQRREQRERKGRAREELTRRIGLIVVAMNIVQMLPQLQLRHIVLQYALRNAIVRLHRQCRHDIWMRHLLLIPEHPRLRLVGEFRHDVCLQLQPRPEGEHQGVVLGVTGFKLLSESRELLRFGTEDLLQDEIALDDIAQAL